MKQDVNFLLLSLLLIALLGMAAIALYAQSEYQKLSGMNAEARTNLETKSALLDNKTAEVESMRTELESRQQALVDMVKELNLSKERQDSLGGFFNDLKGAKQSLEENLSAVEEAKGGVERQLASSKKDLEVCSVTVNFKTQQLANSSSRISKLTNEIAGFSSSLFKADNGLGKINTGLTSIKTDLATYQDQLNDVRSDLRENSTITSSDLTKLSSIVSGLIKTQGSVDDSVSSCTSMNKDIHASWQASLTP